MTNQPVLAGTSPAPLSFSFASRTISRSLSATELLESSPRLLVEPLGERRALLLDVAGRLELGEERLRRHRLDHSTRGRPDRRVARDDAHALTRAVLAREPLDQRVGVRGK